VDESVKLATKYGHSGSAGLVNAVLRRMVRENLEFPDPEREIEDPTEALAVAYSHPAWLVGRWMHRLGEEETRALLAANNRARPLGLRVNVSRTDRETLRGELEARGVESEASPYSRASLRVTGNLVPQTLPEFGQGRFFVQDESETLVGQLLLPQAGETVLDLCAAPGGKTTHIQELRGNDGRVIAVDPQRNRLNRVRENVDRLGLTGVDLVQARGETLALGRPVDRVLVDSPCSGLGVLGRRADARWRKTAKSLRSLLPLEAALLAAGAEHVRPGGVLVYSVCSTEPEETTEQVRRFLGAHPGFRLDPAETYVPRETVTDGCLVLYPHRHGTDGAFAARFLRQG
jgi:16S rRNA (cytosine967-C5)-methyltransferase